MLDFRPDTIESCPVGIAITIIVTFHHALFDVELYSYLTNDYISPAGHQSDFLSFVFDFCPGIFHSRHIPIKLTIYILNTTTTLNNQQPTTNNQQQAQVDTQRSQFWASRGTGYNWQALRTAAEAMLVEDLLLASAVLEASNIVSSNGSLELCFDETGQRYKVNMLRKKSRLGEDDEEEETKRNESEGSELTYDILSLSVMCIQ